MEETAINSALVALVTAKNRRISNAAAPLFPRSVAAATDAGRPAEISAFDKVGRRGMNPLEAGLFTGDEDAGTALRATAASPRVVAIVNGMANLSVMNNRNGELTTRNLPRKATDEICLDRRCRPTSNCTLPVRLILENGSKVSN